MTEDTKKYQLGNKMKDGSYYMGVSESVGEDFYLFIENAFDTSKKKASFVTVDNATDLLQGKYENGDVLHGHIYSAYQSEENILASYKNGTADGGLRRMTKEELIISYSVIIKNNLISELLKACDENIQSISPNGVEEVWCLDLLDGELYAANKKDSFSGVLLVRSDSTQKLQA